MVVGEGFLGKEVLRWFWVKWGEGVWGCSERESLVWDGIVFERGEGGEVEFVGKFFFGVKW